MTQTPLELAQHYVAQGLPVFPCRSHAEEHVDQATGEIVTLGEKDTFNPERIQRRNALSAHNREMVVGLAGRRRWSANR